MFETSAKNGTNVDLAVLALMREVLHHRKYAKEEEMEEADKESGRCPDPNFSVFMSCLVSLS